MYRLYRWELSYASYKNKESNYGGKKREIIEVIGTHPQSFKEIPMTLEAMGKEIIELKKEGQNWCIIFKV